LRGGQLHEIVFEVFPECFTSWDGGYQFTAIAIHTTIILHENVPHYGKILLVGIIFGCTSGWSVVECDSAIYAVEYGVGIGAQHSSGCRPPQHRSAARELDLTSGVLKYWF